MLLQELQRDDLPRRFRWEHPKMTSARDWIVIESKRPGSIFLVDPKISTKDQTIGEVRNYVLGRRTKARGLMSAIDSKQRRLEHILKVIRESRNILELQDDWDTEGGSGYSKATWKRATNFVLNYARKLIGIHGARMPAPSILPGPDGSIDILWKSQDYELLVNVPVDHSAQATFYGNNKSGGFIKGNLDTSTFNKGFSMWLMTEK